ncbi:MAG: prepilin peptidase [Proteobacteria bacterium]|nr:prepilin peptidase [Pseudomonadota bacterium]
MIGELLVLILFPALLVAAAACDLGSFIIPNRIQLALLAAFLVFAVVSGMPAQMFGAHVLAGFLGLAIGFTLFALGYVGGGDAKLFACVSLWFGLSDLLNYAVVASVFGGFLTLGILGARKIPLPAFLAHQGWVMRLHDEHSGIPYGIALATGALAVLPYAEIFRLGIIN